jgi:hypothetical protein
MYRTVVLPAWAAVLPEQTAFCRRERRSGAGRQTADGIHVAFAESCWVFIFREEDAVKVADQSTAQS